jgi:hypothetical protein
MDRNTQGHSIVDPVTVSPISVATFIKGKHTVMKKKAKAPIGNESLNKSMIASPQNVDAIPNKSPLKIKKKIVYCFLIKKRMTTIK